MTSEAKLGPALHGLRKRNHWTLSDVSQKTGLSISTLSKAERNQLSLTYDKLVQLSEGLGVDITTFFEDESHHASSGPMAARRSINRLNEGQVIDTPNYNYVYLCTDLLRKKFVPIVADIRAHSLEEFGPLVKHQGEEFALVLEGTVAVHTEHYAPTVLKTGESIYFDSNMAHAYTAEGSGRCRVLSICSSAEATLMEAMNQHFGQRLPPATARVKVRARRSRKRVRSTRVS